jgi:hypothetical protein
MQKSQLLNFKTIGRLKTTYMQDLGQLQRLVVLEKGDRLEAFPLLLRAVPDHQRLHSNMQTHLFTQLVTNCATPFSSIPVVVNEAEHCGYRIRQQFWLPILEEIPQFVNHSIEIRPATKTRIIVPPNPTNATSLFY